MKKIVIAILVLLCVSPVFGQRHRRAKKHRARIVVSKQAPLTEEKDQTVIVSTMEHRLVEGKQAIVLRLPADKELKGLTGRWSFPLPPQTNCPDYIANLGNHIPKTTEIITSPEMLVFVGNFESGQWLQTADAIKSFINQYELQTPRRYLQIMKFVECAGTNKCLPLVLPSTQKTEVTGGLF